MTDQIAQQPPSCAYRLSQLSQPESACIHGAIASKVLTFAIGEFSLRLSPRHTSRMQPCLDGETILTAVHPSPHYLSCLEYWLCSYVSSGIHVTLSLASALKFKLERDHFGSSKKKLWNYAEQTDLKTNLLNLHRAALELQYSIYLSRHEKWLLPSPWLINRPESPPLAHFSQVFRVYVKSRRSGDRHRCFSSLDSRAWLMHQFDRQHKVWKHLQTISNRFHSMHSSFDDGMSQQFQN